MANVVKWRYFETLPIGFQRVKWFNFCLFQANIDYSSSSKSATEQCDEDNEKCSPQIQDVQADEIIEQGNDVDNFEMNNNNNEESATVNNSDNVGNGAALEMLLKGILGQQQVQAVQPAEQEVQEERPSEKVVTEESAQVG